MDSESLFRFIMISLFSISMVIIVITLIFQAQKENSRKNEEFEKLEAWYSHNPLDKWREEYNTFFTWLDHHTLRECILEILEIKNNHPEEYNLPEIQENLLFDYAHEKMHFIQIKDSLLNLLENDMEKVDISAEETATITKNIKLFTEFLQKLTDWLIWVMPDEVWIIQLYPDPSLFVQSLFEENSWLEGEAESMQLILSKWIGIHNEEVKTEKEKLKLLMKNQYIPSISELMETSGDLLRNNLEKIKVQI